MGVCQKIVREITDIGGGARQIVVERESNVSIGVCQTVVGA